MSVSEDCRDSLGEELGEVPLEEVSGSDTRQCKERADEVRCRKRPDDGFPSALMKISGYGLGEELHEVPPEEVACGDARR